MHRTSVCRQSAVRMGTMQAVAPLGGCKGIQSQWAATWEGGTLLPGIILSTPEGLRISRGGRNWSILWDSSENIRIFLQFNSSFGKIKGTLRNFSEEAIWNMMEIMECKARCSVCDRKPVGVMPSRNLAMIPKRTLKRAAIHAPFYETFWMIFGS